MADFLLSWANKKPKRLLSPSLQLDPYISFRDFVYYTHTIYSLINAVVKKICWVAYADHIK